MTRRNQVLWAVSIVVAIALAVSGMHAKDAAELQHTEAGLYRLMFDSPTIVLILTIATNALVYQYVLTGVLWVWAKTQRS